MIDGESLPGVKEAVVDLKQDSVTTPYGIATTRSAIQANPRQRMTGPWNGFQWKFNDIDPATGQGTLIQFAVGQLTESGQGMLHYRVDRLTKDSKVAHLYIMQYELKAKPPAASNGP